MRKLMILLVLIVMPGMGMIINATPVSKQEAQKIAAAWYRHIRQASVLDFITEKVYTANHEGVITFYTFVFKAGGFVIVAADDASIPILGYSSENPFPGDFTCPSTSWWLDSYSREIFQIVKAGVSNQATKPLWDDIREGTFPPPARDVGPLLTTTWDQGCYYNELCPDVPGGACNHAATGCVATAMAQIMKFHNFPPRGVGMHAYPHPKYGMQSADFGNTTYDWPSMPSQVTSSNIPVATLMYHCGVSVNMIYGYSSGSYMELIPGAFTEFFNYDPGIEINYMNDYENQDWKELLRSNLDQFLPVYYGGMKDSAEGHAFICDGYRLSDETFHFNWGWSGAADGWFAIGALNPGTLNLNRQNVAITEIRPYNPDLVARIINPVNNSIIKSGAEITIEAATIYGNTDWMRITVDGLTVVTGSTASISYNWQTTAIDAGSHEVRVWSVFGEDSVSYGINLNVSDNWIPQSSGFQTPLRGIISISVVDSNIVWAIPRDGVDEFGAPVQEFTRTIDGGQNWTAGIINDCAGLCGGMIFAINAEKAYIPMFRATGSKPRGIYVTSDGGATWNRQTTASFNNAFSFPDCIHFFDENNGWCLGDPIPQNGAMEFEIYTTTDGGENWIVVPAANKPNPALGDAAILSYSAVKDTLWFGTIKGRIYKSTDRGYNWAVYDVPDLAGQWITPVFRNGSHGLVHNFFYWHDILCEGMGEICESFDGGETWTKVDPIGPMYWTDLAYIPGTENTWVSTGGRIVFECGASISYDGGHTWAEMPGTHGTKIRYMDWIDENLGWAGGYNLNDTVEGMFRFEKDVAVSIASLEKQVPEFNVFPNPFSDYTTIGFTIPEARQVSLKIYDLTGREIETLVSGRLDKGDHTYTMNAVNLQSGIYLYRLSAGGDVVSGKLVVRKK